MKRRLKKAEKQLKETEFIVRMLNALKDSNAELEEPA